MYPPSNEKDNCRLPIDRQDNLIMSNSTLHKTMEQSPSDEHTSSFEDLHRLRMKYPKNVIVSYININSVRSKFHNFIDFIDKKVDV